MVSSGSSFHSLAFGPGGLVALHFEIFEAFAFGGFAGVFPGEAKVVEEGAENAFGNVFHGPARQRIAT